MSLTERSNNILSDAHTFRSRIGTMDRVYEIMDRVPVPHYPKPEPEIIVPKRRMQMIDAVPTTTDTRRPNTKNT